MEVSKRKEKGFTTVDMTIAILVMIIFVSIMTSVLYSVSVSTTEGKRSAAALNYAVDIFETIGELDYNNVSGAEIAKRLERQGMTITINSGGTTQGKIGEFYDYTLRIEDTFGDDYVKLITLTMKYKVSAKNEETLEMQRIKAKT